MKYRILYLDHEINGPNVVAALQQDFETEAESPEEAAQHSASAHPFESKRDFWIIPSDQIHKITLRKAHMYEEVSTETVEGGS